MRHDNLTSRRANAIKTPLFGGEYTAYISSNWAHSGPLCHALSLLSWTSMRRWRVTVAVWHLVNGNVKWLAVTNEPNIFQMLLVTNKQLLCWACKNVLLYEKCDILMTWSYFPLLHVIHFNIRSVGCDLTVLSHKHGDIREFDIYFNIRIWWMLWDLWPITAGQCLLTYS